MALILAAVMAVSCLTTILLAASKPWTGVGIGELSQYYETGNNADPGRVSNVKGDSGGTSYGLYMFVEGTVTNFINWLKQQPKGSRYYDFGDTLWRAYNFDVNGNENPGYGTNFKTVWQSIGHGKTLMSSVRHRRSSGAAPSTPSLSAILSACSAALTSTTTPSP